jgi:predicted RNase H-like HicB family nuclease/plasmid stability protein
MNLNSFESLNALNYPVRIEYDSEDSLFVADFLDLPGCSASGSTITEAFNRAQEAKAEWLRVALEQELPIPKPSKTGEYSGRILVRLPESLHSMLASRASINGTSLNQYIVHLLSAGIVGEEVSRKLEALTDHIQNIERQIASRFASGSFPGVQVRDVGLSSNFAQRGNQSLRRPPSSAIDAAIH